MDEAGKTASCLCGGVQYEITGPIHHTRICHCKDCRKFSGASHSASGLVSVTPRDSDDRELSCVLLNPGVPMSILTTHVDWFDIGIV
jgi:hypothetical protein